MSKTFTKNIPVNEILHLGEHLEYKEGQVISITIAQNERLSITLFALPKGEEILIMPSEVPHSLDARESFKMLLTVVK